MRVFALAAAGTTSATRAATPTARILRITSVDSFLRGRPVASLIGGAESSTFLSLLIVLVGKAPRKRECVCQPAPLQKHGGSIAQQIHQAAFAAPRRRHRHSRGRPGGGGRSRTVLRGLVPDPAEGSSHLPDEEEGEERLPKNKQASRSYVAKPDAPVAATAANTAPFGREWWGDDPVDIPGSNVSFTMPKTGLVSLTYSGVSSCEANTAGSGCPFEILVDGYPASTGASAIQTASKTGFGPDPSAHSLTQTSVVGAGPHTASLALASTSDAPTVRFTLKSWNLVVQGFPGS